MSLPSPTAEDRAPFENLTGRVQKFGQFYFAYGGSADIYRGILTDPLTNTHRRVAVKIPRGSHLKEEDMVEITRVGVKIPRGSHRREVDLVEITGRLDRGARVWSGLQHDNVLPFLGVAYDLAPTPALISPLCEEGNVMRYLVNHPNADRAQIIYEIARGLEYLHSKEVIYGDLTSDHILMNDDGRPLIKGYDFYIRGFLSGTIRYMAPELISPQDFDKDSEAVFTKQSDVYSFAMVGIEILTNKQPFHEISSATDVLFFKCKGLPTDYVYFGEYTETWKILESCSAVDPRMRPVMVEVLLSLPPQRGKIPPKTSGTNDKTESIVVAPIFVMVDDPATLQWDQSSQCILAHQASSHSSSVEPLLQSVLANMQFEGQYMIQVGFNERSLTQGMLVEEIYLLLNGDLQPSEDDICAAFTPVFAPFPGIVYTRHQTYYISIYLPPHGSASRPLEVESKIHAVQKGGSVSGVVSIGNQSASHSGEGASNQKKGIQNVVGGTPKEGGREPGGGSDSSSEDDDDFKGKGRDLGARRKAKGRRRGSKLINIPLESNLSIKGIDGSHQITAGSGFDITVNENQLSCPADSGWPNWSSPWFKVSMLNLEFNSIPVNHPPYFLSFAQVRIAASSLRDSLALLDRLPKSLPKEADSAKKTVTKSRAANLGITLGANPTIKPVISASQTSGVEIATTRWMITSHAGTSIDETLPDTASRFAVWKYGHNDLIFDRVEGWSFDHDLCPSVMFGFEHIKTEVQVELTVFWTLNHDPQELKRREFPILWRRAKASKSIFGNFIHHVAALVDLEKVPDDRSWVMPAQKIHIMEREKLTASKGSIHLERITAVAKQSSGSGPQLNDSVSTACEVSVKTVVEGRVSLTRAERTGGAALTVQLSPSPTAAQPLTIPTPAPSPQPGPQRKNVLSRERSGLT